ncbi:homocysteine S-methyltransferase [Colletotrichum paranaense]|uniref:Homocysteine S-methyltransferase n=1 Tax=Colletotrichum paranaense TaxID=1914294 RepID=A0ABQ9STI9_9PEZI|nr:homocysteine S-methyltransferase [Colletotrichum paranaense]KAK1542544.1 homocysteine S-methyltransferase [Colletotrichum paranaense]
MAASSSSQQSKVLILDGGLGTSLEDKYGIKFESATTPLWSTHLLVDGQDTLLACQKDFGDVPVDIILTATYQLSIHGFANTRTAQFPNGIDKANIGNFIQDAIRIADEAGRSQGSKTALSIGPYGACMIPGQEYSGAYDADHDSLEKLRDWHAERLQLFQSAAAFSSPVSYVAIETIPRTDEIKAVRQALDKTQILASETPIPFWIATLFPRGDGLLPDGSSIKEAVTAMLSPDVATSHPWGIGINCTKVWKLESLIQSYESAVKELIQEGAVDAAPALILYPDGTNGEVYNTTTQKWELPQGSQHPNTSWEAQLSQVVSNAESRGLWKQIVVGGCCKASHADIARLRTAVEGLSR